MGESYHHDSTPAGNFLRGWSSVIHAWGNYRLSRSQAALLCEYARSLQTYNHQRWIEFFRGNLQLVEAARQARVAALRAKNEARRPALYRAAYQLTDEELNRKTGEIAWPKVLQAASYTKLRSTLDDLFRKIARGPAPAAVSANRIAACAEALGDQLRRNFNSVDRTDYNAAQNFLCGLKYEPEFSQPGNVATSIFVDESHQLGMN